MPLVKFIQKKNIFFVVMATIITLFIFKLQKEDLKEIKLIKNEIIKTKCDYNEKGPRILCAIFIHQSFHKTKVLPVHETWAKRFIFLFQSRLIIF